MRSHPGQLGSHVIGLPVIFLRSDVLSDLHPDAWDYPYRGLDPTAEEDLLKSLSPDILNWVWQPPSPPSIESLEFAALRAAATIPHEIRHFHDAVITPGLFERYVLEVQRVHISVQILSGLSSRGTPEIALDHLNRDETDLLQWHGRQLAEFVLRYADRASPRGVSGTSIVADMADLLEADAIAAELNRVFAIAGASALDDYWARLQLDLPARYTQLLQRSFAFGGRDSLLAKVERLQQWIISALLSPANPVDAFNAMIEAQEDQPLAPDHGECEHRLRLAAQQEFEPIQVFQLTPYPDDVVVHAAEIFDLRAQVLSGYSSLGSGSLVYDEHLNQFPVPPACFFADDVMHMSRILPFARKADLRKKYGDVFSLASTRDMTRRTTLSAGLIPAPGYDSAFKLRRAEVMLSFRYMTQFLFGDRITYARDIDRAYQDSACTVLGLSMPDSGSR